MFMFYFFVRKSLFYKHAVCSLARDTKCQKTCVKKRLGEQIFCFEKGVGKETGEQGVTNIKAYLN